MPLTRRSSSVLPAMLRKRKVGRPRKVHDGIAETIDSVVKGYSGLSESESEDTRFNTPAPSVVSGRSASEETSSNASFSRASTKSVRLAQIRLESQKVEAEIQIKKLELEHALEIAKLNIAGNSSNDNSNPVRKYFDLFRNSVPKAPENAEELPLFLMGVERLFTSFNISDTDRAHLILPSLGKWGQMIISQCTADELCQFDQIKQRLLEAARLSPAQYYNKFLKLEKGRDETYGEFLMKLRSLFQFYEKSKNVESWEDLRELILSDRLKSSLNPACLQFISLKEGTKTFKSNEIATLAQTFEASESLKPKIKTYESIGIAKYNKPTNVPYRRSPPFTKTNQSVDQNKKDEAVGQRYTRPTENWSKQNKGCFTCGSFYHRKANCNVNKRQTATKQNVRNIQMSNTSTETKDDDGCLVAKINTPSIYHPIPLHRIPIIVNGKWQLNCIEDSGCEADLVIRSSLLPDELIKSYMPISLLSAFGQTTSGKMIKLNLSLGELQNPNLLPEFQVLAIVVDNLTSDGLINPCLVKRLRQQQEEMNISEEAMCAKFDIDLPPSKQTTKRSVTSSGDNSSLRETLDLARVSDDMKESVTIALTEFQNHMAGNQQTADGETENVSAREMFKQRQRNCETLISAYDDAKEGRNSYFLRDAILFHREKVNGILLEQLVLPSSERKKVLDIAHFSYMGGHYGSKKTLDRIKLSFSWPKMRKDIYDFCSSCEACQLRRREIVKDRVPINPIRRPEYPFEVIHMDIAGPIDPPTARGHKYVLCVIDQMSRWPELQPLSSLTARATCDALIPIFSRVGTPVTCVSDLGTNFTSNLTKEFLQRMGVSPRFVSPSHPAANGLAERLVQTTKRILSHVMQEKPKQWDKYLPYVLWAIREVPNSTLGVSPFYMVYGRTPRGPLSILKDNWIGEMDSPDDLGKPVEKYLEELKEKLELAARQAGLESEIKQAAYANYYNLRARDKTFEVGDTVILLIPNSTNKMLARWTGPCSVVKKRSDYSYDVELEDGTKKRVHANKMRKFVRQVNRLAVVYETDDDFGDIPTIETEKDKSPSIEEIMNQLKFEDLTAQQIKELEKVIIEVKPFFSGRLGRTNIIKHEINLKTGFKQKKVPLYRIPEVLKGQINKQIKSLLDDGLISKADVEIAYPIVCVAKKDHTIRLCVDYRGLNAGTQDDAYPITDQKELIQKIANARYISCVDLLQGYWNLPMEEKSRKLTAFATDTQTYIWNVVPYGLKNAGRTMVKAIHKALENHRDYATSFVDDIAIFSNTWKEHLEHIRKVLTTLMSLGFAGNLKKCQFARKRILFLGHIVGNNQVLTDPQKIDTIKKITRPKTKKQLKSVLGLFGYYRDFIKDFSIIACPLFELTKRRTPTEIPWNDVATEAFETLRGRLAEAPALHPPDFSKPFIIDADASNFGIGACLSQKGKQGKEYPISFISSKFSDTQKNYSTIEKEAYAVIFALRKFEHYLFNADVIIRTDHNPLKFLTSTYPNSPKLQRWALALQKFNPTIQHRKGSIHINADILSRLHE